MNQKKYRDRKMRHIASTPFIWAPLLPVMLADIVMEIYHQIGFRLYKIERARRLDYIKVDRHKLSYLSPAEKVFCMYCGYMNGVLPYMAEIAARTEKYWCGIKHEKREGLQTTPYHDEFTVFGDEKAFQEKYVARQE